MTILNALTLVGGIALFLYGMNIMGNGLEKVSGGRLERTLEKLTNKLYKGVFLGLAVTALIQSSSATTVMVVGFVNSGIMKLSQAVGIIMGANVGTTVTAFILSLGDISSSTLILQLLKPSALAPIISIIGVGLTMFAKKGRTKDIGSILLGFGVLFFGMLTMEQSVAGLKDIPEFAEVFVKFSNPFYGILVGTLVTAVIQSSSASVGILQALTSTGVIPFSAAAPIILGQNIGTCITALLASIGASKNAKRAAMIHLYFNLIGATVFIAALYIIQAIFKLPFWDTAMTRGSIAITHMVFNVFSTLLLLPFSKWLVKLAGLTIKDKQEEADELDILDDRFLVSPSLALEKARDLARVMASYSIANFNRARALLANYDSKKMDRIREQENVLDRMQDRLNGYLMKLSGHDLPEADNMGISELMHTIGDIERIGDYAMNIAEVAESMHEQNVSFSPPAGGELNTILDAVKEILDITERSFIGKDTLEARKIEPLEEIIDLLNEVLKARHIERLKKGTCTVDAGTMFIELLVNLERIADHCSNIAVHIIQCYDDRNSYTFDSHEYIRRLHEGHTADYNRFFHNYEQHYMALVNQTSE